MVNMAGEYFLLPDEQLHPLISYKMSNTSELFLQLKAKHFVAESLSDPAVDLMAVKYRTKKSFLYDFTSLHILVVTQRCNQKCSYCQASSEDAVGKGNYDMSIETARKAVDICLKGPAKSIKIEFQGGEPLLSFKTIAFAIDYANQQAARSKKNIEFVVCTNLTLITDDMLKYFAENDVSLSFSLDGPRRVHDMSRCYRNGLGTYDDVVRSLDKARKYMNRNRLSALMTTTKYSLPFHEEIVDEYIKQDLNTIFVRFLNPFGFAKGNREISYSASEFIDFYKRMLRHLVDINLKGIFVQEVFSSILLTRILTPFSTGFVDLQFPAGTGISGVIYGHDGNVYLSDEARMLAQMGDYTFCMGNVYKNTFEELFCGPVIQSIIADTCAEALPGCSECVFQMYCGIDPIRNYVTQGSIVGHRPTSDFCHIHKEIIKFLMENILRDSPEYMDVFWSWITGRDISAVRVL